MTIQRHPIISYFVSVLERIAPLALADRSWDNVGLLFESPVVRLCADNVCRILLTVDLTEAVYQEAVEQDVAIILSYHPPWFRGEKSITLDQSRGMMRMVALCAAKGISIYSPHSALDAIDNGVNTHVTSILCAERLHTMRPIVPAAAPFPGSNTAASCTLI